MKAMILAAGRGSRMRPLTDRIPKALVEINNTPLIAYHLMRIRDAGIVEVVINLGHLGEMIREALKDGSDYGVNISYSDESSHILGTGGGIVKALPLLGDTPFFVVNADVYTDYAIRPLAIQAPCQAHLVMVDNPEHNCAGDFGFSDGFVADCSQMKLTFAGLGYYTTDLFARLPLQQLSLVEILRPAVAAGLVSGEHYQGEWIDVGTIERLNVAQATGL